jgi:hypothetical protein
MAKALYGASAREIAEGVFWLGGCGRRDSGGQIMHNSTSAFLVASAQQALLYDTGPQGHWLALEESLEGVLDDRPLDWIIPSHPEVPHSGCLARLAAKYPNARIAGDVRDYHLYYPEISSRLEPMVPGSVIDLGDGYQFVIAEAVIKDLPNTVWGYEAKTRVLFVSDAFQYFHYMTEEDEALHRPGDCRSMSSELPQLPTVEQAKYITRGGLLWTAMTDASYYIDQVVTMLGKYPARLLAPTHGNVIDDLDGILPVMREAYGGEH